MKAQRYKRISKEEKESKPRHHREKDKDADYFTYQSRGTHRDRDKDAEYFTYQSRGSHRDKESLPEDKTEKTEKNKHHTGLAE
jgi:hypothetical protein